MAKSTGNSSCKPATWPGLLLSFRFPMSARSIPKRKGCAVRLAGLLQLAGVKPSAKYLTLHATRDDFHASVPLAEVEERAILMTSSTASRCRYRPGGPVRLLIADYAACKTAEVDEWRM